MLYVIFTELWIILNKFGYLGNKYIAHFGKYILYIKKFGGKWKHTDIYSQVGGKI